MLTRVSLAPARAVAVHGRIHLAVQCLADAGRSRDSHSSGPGPDRRTARVVDRRSHPVGCRPATERRYLDGSVRRTSGHDRIADGLGNIDVFVQSRHDIQPTAVVRDPVRLGWEQLLRGHLLELGVVPVVTSRERHLVFSARGTWALRGRSCSSCSCRAS